MTTPTTPGAEPLRIAMNLVRMTRDFIVNGHEHLETVPRAALTDPRVREHWTRVMNHLAATRLGLDELAACLAALARHDAEPRHPLVGPDAPTGRLARCPDCGQLEWWHEAELADHGRCRAAAGPCPVCNEPVGGPGAPGGP